MKRIFTLLACAMFLNFVQANVIYVDDTAGGNNDGTSWTDAYTDLKIALDASTNGDTIAIAAGTYKPHASSIFTSFDLKEGIKIFGGFVGNETVNAASIAARDIVANETILSGDLSGDDVYPNNMSDNSYHVVYVDATLNITSATEMDGLTISGGNAIGTDPNYLGGGMFIDAYNSLGNGTASPTLRNINFKNNSAGYGGGVSIVSFPSTGNITILPTFENCVFQENHATNNALQEMHVEEEL